MVAPRTPWLLAVTGITAMLIAVWPFAVHGTLFHSARSDFHGLWSFGRFALTDGPAAIYDHTELRHFQWTLGELTQTGFFLYAYPPHFLLLLAPLAMLPLLPARLIWTLCTLAGYLQMAAACAGGAWRARAAVIIAALIAPSTAITAIFGQTGFLSGALLGGGLLLLGSRPRLAGVLLGLLSFKPQLGLLVPVALLAAGAWRAIGAACVTAAGLALASMLVLGSEIWWAWMASLGEHVALLDASRGQRGSFHIAFMPTLFTAMIRRGAPAWLAWSGQIAAALVVAGTVWRCFRRGPSVDGAILVMLGTCLVTPYAFIYDLPMVTAAGLALLARRLYASPDPPVAEAVLLVTFQLTLAGSFNGSASVALVMCANLLLFCLAMARSSEARPGAG